MILMKIELYLHFPQRYNFYKIKLFYKKNEFKKIRIFIIENDDLHKN